MRGVIVGGWSYVWAAYTVTIVILTVYAISLFKRLSDARRGEVSS
jgi:heme exporter protein D